jgi:hypothetical protein
LRKSATPPFDWCGYAPAEELLDSGDHAAAAAAWASFSDLLHELHAQLRSVHAFNQSTPTVPWIFALAQLGQASALRHARDWDGAAAAIARARTHRPCSAAVLWAEALLELDRSDPAKATTVLESLLWLARAGAHLQTANADGDTDPFEAVFGWLLDWLTKAAVMQRRLDASLTECGGDDQPECSHVLTTHYSILGVPIDADAKAIKRAYKMQSRLVHPDRHGSTAAFARLAEAYETLIDPDRRQRYDLGIDLSSAGSDAESLQRVLERRYFAERFIFEPFGEIHPDRVRAEPPCATEPNAPGISSGSYTRSCGGCAEVDGALFCSACSDGGAAGAQERLRWSALRLADCSGQDIANNCGRLECALPHRSQASAPTDPDG